MDTEVHDVQAKLNTHEAVCAERYLGINARLKRIEAMFLGGVGTIFVLLLSIVLKMEG
jgi:hypothetical protein